LAKLFSLEFGAVERAHLDLLVRVSGALGNRLGRVPKTRRAAPATRAAR
jgi:hypothetical protein